MNVTDLLNPDKMKAIDEKFRPATQEDFDKAKEQMLQSRASPPVIQAPEDPGEANICIGCE